MTKKATTMILKFTEKLELSISIYKNGTLPMYTADFTEKELATEYDRFLKMVGSMYLYDMLSEKDHANLYETACDIYINACKVFNEIKYNR